MDMIEGLRAAFSRDADTLRNSIQAERQWCLDAFITARPILAMAVADARSAFLYAPVQTREHKDNYTAAADALAVCDRMIRGLREGIADLEVRRKATGK